MPLIYIRDELCFERSIVNMFICASTFFVNEICIIGRWHKNWNTSVCLRLCWRYDVNVMRLSLDQVWVRCWRTKDLFQDESGFESTMIGTLHTFGTQLTDLRCTRRLDHPCPLRREWVKRLLSMEGKEMTSSVSWTVPTAEKIFLTQLNFTDMSPQVFGFL